DARMSPRGDVACGIADPRLSDAETADETDQAIHGDHLAVIAADPAQRTRRSRRVVAADLDAARPQPVPESPRRLAEPAHPVVDDAYRHALARPRYQRVAELLADFVVVNDVALEVDVAARAGDRIGPRGIVLGRGLRQPTRVAP